MNDNERPSVTSELLDWWGMIARENTNAVIDSRYLAVFVDVARAALALDAALQRATLVTQWPETRTLHEALQGRQGEKGGEDGQV